MVIDILSKNKKHTHQLNMDSNISKGPSIIKIRADTQRKVEELEELNQSILKAA